MIHEFTILGIGLILLGFGFGYAIAYYQSGKELNKIKENVSELEKYLKDKDLI